MNNKLFYNWGLFCSFFSAFAWGSSHITGRWLMSNEYIDAVSLCAIRYTFGGLLMVGLGLIFRRKKILAVNFKDLLKLSCLGFLGITAHTTCLLYGQKYTSAINCSLILCLNPIIAMVVTLFMGHRFSFIKMFGMAISLFGSMMVIGVISSKGFSYDTGNIKGDLFVFASAIFWALYIVLSKNTVSKLGGYTSTAWGMLLSAVQFLVLSFFWQGKTIIPEFTHSMQWLVISYVILIPTVAAFYFFYEAMTIIKLSLLNIMQYLSPVTTIILSYVILGERMSLTSICGAVLTVIGVMVASGAIKNSLLKRKFKFRKQGGLNLTE